MTDTLVEGLIQKLLYLEGRVGDRVPYKMMDPFNVIPSDPISLQQAAAKIASFVGLGNLTFIVAVAKQEAGIGGHIELRHGDREVFIEISQTTTKFPAATLAVLAHEITHKYLHVNDCYLQMGGAFDRENEILTDIASVFLGLGKLLLNGNECSEYRSEISGMVSTTTTRTTLETGYLTRMQFVVVYQLICAMRKIPLAEYRRGLVSEAAGDVTQSRNVYGDALNPLYHEPNAGLEISAKLRKAVSEEQENLSHIERNLLVLRSNCIDATERFLEERHKKLNELLLAAQGIANDDIPDPAMKFLKRVLLNMRAREVATASGNPLSEISSYRWILEKVRAVATSGKTPFSPEVDQELFTILVCRNDGTKLRVPKGKSRLTVRCPRCKYEFIAGTTLPKPAKVPLLRSMLSKVRQLYGY